MLKMTTKLLLLSATCGLAFAALSCDDDSNGGAATPQASDTPTGRGGQGTGSIPPEVMRNDAQWPLANGDYRSTRSASNSSIDASSVQDLGVAWEFDIPAEATFGAAATNPIIADDVVFLQDLASNVHALDLESGELLWQTNYDNDVIGPNGVAVGYGKVYATSDPRTLVALDIESGDQLWTSDIGYPTNYQPIVFDGMVYVGTTAGGNNSYEGGTSGHAIAFDAETGERVWEFQVVEEGFWGNPELNSGGGLWYPPAIDVDDGVLYWGTGNPAPFPGTVEFPNGTSRPGPNLYTNSVVALDHQSGELQWHVQLLPHDILDLDTQIPPIPALVEVDGEDREVVIVSGKIGVVYGIDAQTHDILWEASVGTHQNDELQELPLGEEIEVLPGTLGGVETPMAFADGVVYAAALNLPTVHTATSWGATTGPEALQNASEHTAPPTEGTSELAAVSATDGTVLWRTQFEDSNFGAVTVVNDLVFTSTYSGVIYALDRASGDEVWSMRAPAGINSPPAVAGDTIVFAAGLGETPKLIALRVGAETGNGTEIPTPTAPAATPTTGASGTTLEIATLENSTFTKSELRAPAGTEITVEYLNDTDIPHNIHFYRGPDATSPDLASTEIAAGPDDLQTVTFTTPVRPDRYYFQCDVHPLQMTGFLVVG